MESIENLIDDKLDNNPIFQKSYINIKNSLNNINSPSYLSIKKTILNIIEQNFSNKFLIDKIFINILNKLLSENFISNPLLLEIIKNKKNLLISDLDSLFIFKINKGVKNKIKNKEKNPIEKFELRNNIEFEYSNFLKKNEEICKHIKTITIQILGSLSFGGSKTPTSPLKFKNFIQSFLKNQKLKRFIENKLHLDYKNTFELLTEGITMDFIKLNIVSFPSETKIHYNLSQIEKEKFRLNQINPFSPNNNLNNNNNNKSSSDYNNFSNIISMNSNSNNS